ncbi:MAG: hypothetical protein RIC16_09835 [Rhodospirillales bacterium]
MAAVEKNVAFLAQLMGAVMGAVAGFGLGEMLIVGVADHAIDMRFILAGLGALIGFVIGRLIASRYEREAQNTSGNSEK